MKRTIEATWVGLSKVFVGALALMMILLGVIPGFLLEIIEGATVAVF